jgi:hypothetical protein
MKKMSGELDVKGQTASVSLAWSSSFDVDEDGDFVVESCSVVLAVDKERLELDAEMLRAFFETVADSAPRANEEDANLGDVSYMADLDYAGLKLVYGGDSVRVGLQGISDANGGAATVKREAFDRWLRAAVEVLRELRCEPSGRRRRRR